MAYIDNLGVSDPCRVRTCYKLDDPEEVETVIEALAEVILDAQNKFSSAASDGYSSEANRHGRVFKGMLQLHDSLVVQYEAWYLARWGTAPVYCKLQAEEFAVKPQPDHEG
ncbi:MAG: hypothetical protein H7241_08020 [Novosphingobium sp.]|nr:hypothetical protein [Novosphingobium sp.]